MNGVLVVDKPAGPTSHDVVARVRRAIAISRIGHTGTLDPLATGVLPLVVGRATRLAQFLSASDKEYIADIRFGFTTETYDGEGPLMPAGFGSAATDPFELFEDRPSHVDRGWGVEFERGASGAIDAVLAQFRGSYWQMPPPYSAKKVGGTPAYQLARRKKPVELKPVQVSVQALEVVAIEGDVLRVRIVCSSGFYVRTLAHDLGGRVGCGAYLAALRRTRAGSFTAREAVALDAVAAESFDALAHMIPLNRLLPDLPSVVLGEAGVRRIGHGNAVTLDHLADRGCAPPADAGGGPPPAKVRLLDESGALLGIAEWRPGALLHPTIVLM
jgi:tRNA pseudouridine55 synthase